MQRIRMRKKTAYFVFVALFAALFSSAWIVFGPFSLGAFVAFIVLLFGMRLILRRCFEFHER